MLWVFFEGVGTVNNNSRLGCFFLFLKFLKQELEIGEKTKRVGIN